jgi:hypothetical protein
MNKLFISYRSESDAHTQAVRRLGELLRARGIPVILDQFFLQEKPGGPAEGWAKWCEDCASHAKAVIVVGSQGWFDVWENTAPPGVAHGSAFEAAVLRQYLYQQKTINERMRLVLLHDLPESAFPTLLGTWHKFSPFAARSDLEQLIQWIQATLELEHVESPTAKWPEPVPFDYRLADRNKEEWPAIVDLLTGRSSKRILLIEGESGLGKSALITQAIAYAKQLGLRVVQIDMKNGLMDVPAMLGQFSLDAADRLPDFVAHEGNKTHLLRKDLRALCEPLVVVLDHFEGAADNKVVLTWVQSQLLAEVATSLSLAVIIGGQDMSSFEKQPWPDLICRYQLEPIISIEDWETWFGRRYPAVPLDRSKVELMVKLAHGNPSRMAVFAETLAR